jgi:restriction endonuclease Mrr
VGRVADKVVLIDGEMLANLMIAHSVGYRCNAPTR